MGLLKTELGPVVEEMYNHSKKLKLSKVTKPLFKFCVSLCDYILKIAFPSHSNVILCENKFS